MFRLKNHRGAIVVATGGHLEQAIRRVNQLGLTNSVTFFTGNNSQSTSKLAGYQHEFIRNVGSRDLIGLVRSFIQLAFKLKKSKYKYVLSTGAGIAIACALVCKMNRIKFYYVESIARQHKPRLNRQSFRKNTEC
jgi:UDP-N-acetylglucosamine:LPS N-acetylglucosamine transferase